MRFVACSFAFALSCPFGFAQEPTVVAPADVVLAEGAQVGDGVTLVNILNVDVTEGGAIAALVELAVDDGGAGVIVRALWRDGVVIATEGQALPGLGGAVLATLDASQCELNNGAQAYVRYQLAGSDSGVGLFRNLIPVILEGDVANGAGFGPGSTWIDPRHAATASNGQLLVVGRIDDPTVQSGSDPVLARMTVNGAGQVQAQQVLLKEGQPMIGAPGPITDIADGRDAIALGNDGSWMGIPITQPPQGLPRASIVRNGQAIATDDQPSPIQDRNWANLAQSRVSINDSGLPAFRGRLTGVPGTNEIIVVGNQVLVQRGDVLPDTAPLPMTSFENSPIDVSNDGDVLWAGRIGVAQKGAGRALFVNQRVIVREQQTVVDGSIVVAVGGARRFGFSDGGSRVVAHVLLSNGRESVIAIDLGNWQALPGQLGSAFGIPHLWGSGNLVEDFPVAVNLHGARPNAATVLVVGFSPINQNLAGMLIVPSPDFVITDVVTDAFGTAVVSDRWPKGIPAATPTFAQWFVLDATAQNGVAASNAVVTQSQ